MSIPTEPIGSIPRSQELVEGLQAFGAGQIGQQEMDALFRTALADTIQRFEATGSPVITDGEQTKPSFATYPIHGLTNLAPDGVTIPFVDGHTRQLPRLAGGPFQYATYADSYLEAAKQLARVPVKQAVISASALSLLYPGDGIDGYPREEFIADLLRENEADIRRSLDQGAYNVQIDFTEGRLAVKLDPSGQLLKSFVGLNNQVLERFSANERQKLGVHTCPGGDHDSTHSADVDYADLLPDLLELRVSNFYIQLASEQDRPRVLRIIKDHAKPEQRIFVGVIDPIDPRIETPEEVRDRVLEAAEFIPLDRLGTTDDCGFSPFADDASTSRDTAFAKIRARVEGTALAAQVLGV
ncbi:MAG: 5-methyltetrahydropteroyltriglutamate--homocysteine methyltransferase [Anaerolineae bacterium]|nr:5-methyltetrahydropteroyltriglutamate--homocysteine methyltransferase [Anaerolineae bacterium]